jgi:hypothetical protein
MGYFFIIVHWVFYFMSLNHELSYHLVEYLSNQNFRDSEFKEIFNGFKKENPEFSSNNSYQRTYRIIRELVNCDLMILKRTHHNYRYTSNYSVSSLNNFLLKQDITIDFKDKLKSEFAEVNLNIEKTRLEINFFDKYMKEYPILKDTILQFKKKSQQKLTYLESQICVLNIISTNV